MENQLDQNVVNLAKAIRQHESNDGQNLTGALGEKGLYQFTKDTWNSVAPKYNIKSSFDTATPQEQNAVAYNRIKEWKDKGYNVTQIASMWNAGEGEPDAYKGTFKTGKPSIGENQGVHYDVPAYAKKVSENYLNLKNASQSQPKDYPLQSAAQSQEQKPMSYVGENPNDSTFAKLTDNSITRGVSSIFPGGKLGQTLGNSLYGIKEAIKQKSMKPLYESGAENSKLAPGAILDSAMVALSLASALPAAKVAGNVASNVGKFFSKGAKAIESPIVEQALGGSKLFSKLRNVEKLDGLANALKDATLSESIVIKQAMKELEPMVMKELGLGPTALRKMLNATANAGLKGLKYLGGPLGTGAALYEHYKK